MNLAGTLIYQNKNQNLDIDANHTCLCNHVWKLKSSTPPIPYNIVWDIVARAATYNPATGYCDLKRSTELCLNLKVHPSTRGLNFLLTVTIKDLNSSLTSNKKT